MKIRIITLFIAFLICHSVFSQSSPILIKTNLFSFFTRSLSVKTEVFMPKYFSLETGFTTTKNKNWAKVLWSGNAYIFQTNYYMRNKTRNGFYFAVFAQYGKWRGYHPDEKYKVGQFQSFSGGFLFGKRFAFRNKHWMLDFYLGPIRSIILSSKRFTNYAFDHFPASELNNNIGLNLSYRF